MSMVPNNSLDFQWAEELQEFCKIQCPHDKDFHHCIGLCIEAQRLQLAEFRRKNPNMRVVEKSTGQEPAKVERVVPFIEIDNPSGHMLVVHEVIDFTATKIAEFDLATAEREQFLPEWRAIGESAAQRFKK